MTNSLDDLDAVRDNFFTIPTFSRPGPDMISAKSGCPIFIVTQYNPAAGHSVPASLNGPTQVFTAPDKTLSPLSHPVPPSIPR